MAYKQEPQGFASKINILTIGVDGNEITIGGENVWPFYTFDAPVENRPKIGVAISDTGYRLKKGVPGIDAYYAGAETVVDVAKKASLMPGADFLVLSLESAHPDGGDNSPDECAALATEIADAVDIPLVVEGCANAVILRHPDSVAAVSALIDALM